MSTPGTQTVHHTNLKEGSTYLAESKSLGEAYVVYQGENEKREMELLVKEGCLVKRSTRERFTKGKVYLLSPEAVGMFKFSEDHA